MILPQANAFSTLGQRVQVVQSGLLLEANYPGQAMESNGAGAGMPLSETDMEGLLERFDKVTQALWDV